MFRKLKYDMNEGLFWHNVRAKINSFLYQDPSNPRNRTKDNINGSMKIGDDVLPKYIHRDRSIFQKLEIIFRNYQGRIVFLILLINIAILLTCLFDITVK